jgi:hypothetical protein
VVAARSESRVNSLFILHRPPLPVVSSYFPALYLRVSSTTFPVVSLQMLRLISRDSGTYSIPAAFLVKPNVCHAHQRIPAKSAYLERPAVRSQQTERRRRLQGGPFGAATPGVGVTRAYATIPMSHRPPSGVNSVGRVPASQAGCRGFDPRTPLHLPSFEPCRSVVRRPLAPFRRAPRVCAETGTG